MCINGVGGFVSKLICSEENKAYICINMIKDASEPIKIEDDFVCSSKIKKINLTETLSTAL
jgi:hypothetical protein